MAILQYLAETADYGMVGAATMIVLAAIVLRCTRFGFGMRSLLYLLGRAIFGWFLGVGTSTVVLPTGSFPLPLYLTPLVVLVIAAIFLWGMSVPRGEEKEEA